MEIGVDVRAECERFLQFATHFIEWLDEADRVAEPSPSELLRILTDLQVAAVRLPDDIGETELTDHDDQGGPDPKVAWDLARRVCLKLPFNVYTAVFDPVDDNPETMKITLDDDLGDIYNDLADGVRDFEAGRYGDALWNWRFSYWNHWGRHLTHAHSAVYSHLAAWGAYKR